MAVPGSPAVQAGTRKSARARAAQPLGSLIGGRYRVDGVLGRGGMGAVYRVIEEGSGQTLALKQLFFHGTSDAEWQRLRFRREFHTMARLRHPRIVEVYEYGLDGRAPRDSSGDGSLPSRLVDGPLPSRKVDGPLPSRKVDGPLPSRLVDGPLPSRLADGRRRERGEERALPFYTMELLDGRDLRELGPVSIPRACALLRDVALALAFLHTKRLIHRDLAPRNVRCTGDGRAKLIDFGVLATTGAFGDVAGTPPFLAPENARGLPIDHRADLFGLGALSYWLLTGKHAYPARHLEELPELWQERPPPPSAVAADVPAELDALVMSLLSLDPLARPRAAAEVIDRLSALGGLSPVSEEEAAQGYLASAVLVGRQREVDFLRRRVQKAQRGEGGAVVLEAPSGTGKSRLLRELGLEAQVAGASVLMADSEAAGRGPYGLLRALARALLAIAPEEAREAGRKRAAVIGRVVPELGPPARATPGGDPTEERARLQAELGKWFFDVATRRTLVILVDDVQRSDEASAAVLASLAHGASGRRLLLLLAARTDEQPRALAAYATMRDASARVRLRGLEVADVEELTHGLFGDVPGSARLARWLHRAGGGSPLHTLELTRHLVDGGMVRCIDGIWSIPEEPRLEGLPKGLAEAMQARIATLGPAARSLADALSVHGGELTLPLCSLLVQEQDAIGDSELLSALDELLYQQVLIGSGETYRFRHDGLREALLSALDVERRRRLHLRVGRALSSSGEVAPEREAEVGWHLLWGGERKQGGDLLARAGRRLYEAQSFSDAAAPLEAALEVFEQEQATLRDRLELRHMLVMVGAMSDRQVALRYADDTIAIWRRLSGASLAARISPWVGGHIAFAVALVSSFFSWVFSFGRRARPGPLESLHLFYVEVAYLCSVRSLSLHVEELRALVELLAPFAIFRDRMARGAWLMGQNLLGMAIGQWGLVNRNCLEMLHILEVDRISPLTETDRKNADGATRYMMAMVSALRQDPGYARELARLEALALRFFDVSANVCRVTYHRFRGEEDQALDLEARLEVQLVQLGSMWGPESTLEWVSSLAFGLTRDVLGLRRRIEAIDRLVKAGYRLEPHLDLARGEYLRERGEIEPAREALERSLAALLPEERFIRPAVLCALAETHLAAHDFDRARRIACEALELGSDVETGMITWKLRAERTLALVEAATGDIDAAAERLDRGIAEARAIESPSLCGSLHEARVRVAVLASDTLSYELHRREADRWFRATKNPALIARIERLPDPPSYGPKQPQREGEAGPEDRTEVVSRDGLVPVPGASLVSDGAVTQASGEGSLSRMLTGCRGADERAARVLNLIVEHSSAVSGYLYLLKDGGLTLVAPAAGEEPPDAVARELARRIADADHGSGELVTHVDWHARGGEDPVPWRPILLRTRVAGKRVAVGIAAVVEGAIALRNVSASIVARLARELYESGDVTAAEQDDVSE